MYLPIDPFVAVASSVAAVAIILYIREYFLRKKGFQLIQPPYMLKREVLEGAITLDAFEDAIYKIENEDLIIRKFSHLYKEASSLI